MGEKDKVEHSQDEAEEMETTVEIQPDPRLTSYLGKGLNPNREREEQEKKKSGE